MTTAEANNIWNISYTVTHLWTKSNGENAPHVNNSFLISTLCNVQSACVSESWNENWQKIYINDSSTKLEARWHDKNAHYCSLITAISMCDMNADIQRKADSNQRKRSLVYVRPRNSQETVLETVLHRKGKYSWKVFTHWMWLFAVVGFVIGNYFSLWTCIR